MTQVILGLGSNLGDREGNLRRAVELVEAELLSEVIESSIYESPPLMPANAPLDWDRQFMNMVIAGELKFEISPTEFLGKVKDFEAAIGRKLSAKWAPRIIDIDILAWGDKIVDLPSLKIPHVEMLKRDFVMKPLREILPGWKHP